MGYKKPIVESDRGLYVYGLKLRDRWMSGKTEYSLWAPVKEVECNIESVVKRDWLSDSKNNFYYRGQVSDLASSLVSLLLKFRFNRDLLRTIYVDDISIDNLEIKTSTDFKLFISNFAGAPILQLRAEDYNK